MHVHAPHHIAVADKAIFFALPDPPTGFVAIAALETMGGGSPLRAIKALDADLLGFILDRRSREVTPLTSAPLIPSPLGGWD